MRQHHFFRTGILNVVFQVVYLAVFYLVGSETAMPLAGAWRDLLLLAFVLVPSLVWTIFFYLQDRLEPEPTSYVLLAFLGGMASAALIALPVTQGLFGMDAWLYQSTSSLVLGSFLLIGAVAAFCFYLVVRYGFYPSKEFDEPVDGNVYGAFAGSGYAFITSLSYLSHHPDFTLFTVAYTATVNILIYASVGSLVGLTIGQAKFSKKSTEMTGTLGMVIGMVLLGVYHILNEFVFVAGWGDALVASFVLTLVFSLIVMGIVVVQMRRLTKTSLHQELAGDKKFEPLPVILVLLALIGAGFMERNIHHGASYASDKYGVSLRYPYSLSLLSSAGSENSLFSEFQTLFEAEGSQGGKYSIAVKVRKGETDMQDFDITGIIGGLTTMSLFTDPVTIAGKEGVRLKYSYVKEGNMSKEGFAEVHWVYADVISAGGSTFLFTYEATPRNFVDQQHVYDNLLTTVQWTK